ncbi:MAG: tetratricopeptide repeat protein [Deltaproteobacteria bacterium]|nr:tetratricopeptide repeat protein [Deltaproteobacteria bacterium]
MSVLSDNLTAALTQANNGKLQEARPLIDQVLAEQYFQAGYAAYQNGQYAQALPYYRAAIEQLPQWYEPHWHAGVCCHQLRRYAEAIDHYRHAVALKPDHAVARYHLAKCLKDDGQLDAALSVYEQALALDPENPEILYSQGLLHLLRGDWLEGWEGYELRLQGSDRASIEHRPATQLPKWHGEEVEQGGGIIVYAEQGMGDSIQCFRYALVLRERFARVKISVHFYRG